MKEIVRDEYEQKRRKRRNALKALAEDCWYMSDGSIRFELLERAARDLTFPVEDMNKSIAEYSEDEFDRLFHVATVIGEALAKEFPYTPEKNPVLLDEEAET
jgi:hypothetical protein